MKRRFIVVTTDFGSLERYRTRPSLTNPKLGEAKLRNVGGNIPALARRGRSYFACQSTGGSSLQVAIAAVIPPCAVMHQNKAARALRALRIIPPRRETRRVP